MEIYNRVRRLFDLNANQPFETFQQTFSATDLGIIKALDKNGKRPPKKIILEMAEKWRPYCAYAALCLWTIED